MAEEEQSPWEIMSKTNYGATSLLNTISETSKRRAARQAASSRLLSSMQAPQMTVPKSPGKGPTYTPNRRGNTITDINGSQRFQAFVKAITAQESGGNYQAVNADSGAAGRYQIMPGNFVGPGGWDKDALGRDISLRFFMRHPRAQDRIATDKLKYYFKKYGARGAAQAWYGGEGSVGDDDISGGSGYPTTGGYADQILALMRKYMRR